MKKYLLVLLCFLLAGCQQPIKEEPLQKTTLFDKASSSDIEKIIVSDAESAQIIRNQLLMKRERKKKTLW